MDSICHSPLNRNEFQVWKNFSVVVQSCSYCQHNTARPGPVQGICSETLIHLRIEQSKKHLGQSIFLVQSQLLQQYQVNCHIQTQTAFHQRFIRSPSVPVIGHNNKINEQGGFVLVCNPQSLRLCRSLSEEECYS